MTDISSYAKTAAVKIKNAACDGQPRVHKDVKGHFFLPGKGRPIGERGIMDLIAAGRLTPAGDGLLPETSQTYLLDAS